MRGSLYERAIEVARFTESGRVLVRVHTSMSRKGDCWDNAVAESFFGTLEQELAGRAPDRANAEAADAAVVDYIIS